MPDRTELHTELAAALAKVATVGSELLELERSDRPELADAGPVNGAAMAPREPQVAGALARTFDRLDRLEHVAERLVVKLDPVCSAGVTAPMDVAGPIGPEFAPLARDLHVIGDRLDHLADVLAGTLAGLEL